MSLHDAFENFLITSTCTHTSKYDCIRSRLVSFIRLTSNMMIPSRGGVGAEQKFINFMDKLIDHLDLDEFLSLFGYFFKQLKEHYGLAVFNVLAANTTIDKMLFVYKTDTTNGSNTAAANRANSRISALLNRSNTEKKGVS